MTETINWLWLLEAYFGGYSISIEDSRGYGALEYTTEDLWEDEEEGSGYYRYGDDMGYSSYGFGFGYGGKEDGYGYGREEVETKFGKSLDEMRLCESIFGYWPAWHVLEWPEVLYWTWTCLSF